MTGPRLSVLMPVFNGAPFVATAVDSVLHQTFGDLELIVVDDGSTDETPAILDRFEDARLVRLRNRENRGLSRSLDRGLERATGEYLARMDADDIAGPDRLAKQVAFLDSHPDVGILGSACTKIDEEGNEIGTSDAPLTDVEIRWRSLTGNPFHHPSVVVRSAVLDRHGLRYDESFLTSQDYELWTRVLAATKGANLPEALVSHRIHDKATSVRAREQQRQDHARVALRTIGDLWPDHPLDAATFDRLRRLLTAWRPLGGAADRERCRLLATYVELFERFLRRHGTDDGADTFRRSEAVAMAALALMPPLRGGAGAVLARLGRLQPNLIRALVLRALSRPWRRLSAASA